MKKKLLILNLLVTILLSLILLAACSSSPNDTNGSNGSSTTIKETNHTKNQLFDITFAGCTKGSKGITVLGSTATASSGNVFQELAFNIRSLSNSVEYIDYSTNISMELSNGHKYYGYCKSYKFMPETSDIIYVYFETSATENINGATITFKWDSYFLSSPDPTCTMYLSNSVESTLKTADVTGMYALSNATDGKWEGYCCINEDGKYWQVVDGIQSEGTWIFAGETNINIIVNKQSTIFEFVSGEGQYLGIKGSNYYSAKKLSNYVNYFYGIYEGSDLQINNTMVGRWLNPEEGVGFEFKNDKSAILFALDKTTSTWNGATGFTWSYANGEIRIIDGGSFDISSYVAKAYGANGEELYLNGFVFHKYQ